MDRRPEGLDWHLFLTLPALAMAKGDYDPRGIH